ncbi:MAG: DinB family protein [Candidatus Acidiferrales bacterium]|jgi:hypothetical protein
MKPAHPVLGRPGSDECPQYYAEYVALVPEDDILAVLESQIEEVVRLFAARSETDGEFRYAPGKWSIKEVLGHVIDVERVDAYRALRVSRNDQTPLPGFEQDDYVRYGPFARCRLADLVEEFIHVRRANLAMFRALDEGAWLRRGVANNHEVSVRALAYVLAGHARHHRRIIEEHYLPALPRP